LSGTRNEAQVAGRCGVLSRVIVKLGLSLSIREPTVRIRSRSLQQYLLSTNWLVGPRKWRGNRRNKTPQCTFYHGEYGCEIIKRRVISCSIALGENIVCRVCINSERLGRIAPSLDGAN
jgi:hypothetical protein